MTKQDVMDKVVEVIADSVEAEGEVTVDSHLISDLGLSSMEAMLILGDLENEFGIDLPINDLKGIKTVGDLAQHVIKKLSE